MRNIGRAVGISLLLGLISNSTFADGIKHFSYAFSKKYTTSISYKTLSETPEWEEGADNPPVSARRAIKLADARRKELVKDTDDYKWHQKSAKLVFYKNTDSCYWDVYYEADFKGMSIGPPEHLHLYVLMDGKLVEPVVSDRR